MAKTHSRQVKTERTTPIELEVLATARVSPSFTRITVGGGEIDKFAPRGFDQWFRLFLPPEGADGVHLPDRDGYLGYAQLLRTPKAVRPTMRNYTVRAYRGATAERGAELDIDFVLHEHPETGALEGVAAAWAASCTVGDRIGLLDEGYGFDAPEEAAWFLLVADETGLPAVAGIAASLPADARGVAIVEIPHADDVQEFPKPEGLVVHWVVREHHDRPGAGAYAAASTLELPADVVTHGYAVGESGLATGIRRLLVNERGWAKSEVSFCGYWRLPKGAPAVESAQLIGA
ncbi:siderophore-interacting protein [Agromyces sp. NPDC058110]|uniref:siderophore-interacting protein n=1 Tax=Agromyces sp. NPDC058110 TaxID=3346345 RepID=UPI0036DF81DD